MSNFGIRNSEFGRTGTKTGPSALGASPLSDALRAGHALIPYLTACDPSFEASLEALGGAVEGGAAVLEIGIPFSDPVADGPVIQAAHQRARAAGGSVARTLELVRRLRQHSAVPVVLFTYLNPLLAFGLERFAAQAAEAGAQGVLCLDLPPGEEPTLLHAFRSRGLDPIVLVTPNTTPQRAGQLVREGGGFVYVTSRSGVTGTHRGAADDLQERVSAVKGGCDLPTAVGFGVRTREDAESLWTFTEGVVVGSALVSHLQAGAPEEARRLARDFVRSLVGPGQHEPMEKEGATP